MELLREGNRSGAAEAFQRGVDVTPRMAYNLIQVLKQDNVDYIVAPYEADAQMAFLSLNGLVDAVITEDSDLVPYGASRILFKVDQTGQGKEFRREDIEATREMDLRGFTSSMIRHMCIMAGCDYLEGLNGFGVKKAHQWIRKYKDDMDRIFTLLKMDRNVALPENYETSFKQADLTFQHQRVFDPRTGVVRPLTDFPADVPHEHLDFIGPHLEPQIGAGIARAELDPHRKTPFEEAVGRRPDGAGATSSSTDSQLVATNRNVVAREAIMFQRRRQSFDSYAPTSAKKGQILLPNQTNKLDTYFSKSFNAPSASSAATFSKHSIVAGDADADSDDDIDLSNITRDSDDDSSAVAAGNDGAPFYHAGLFGQSHCSFTETFENMTNIFGTGSPTSKRKAGLASSTGELCTGGSPPSLRRATTEPAFASSLTKVRVLYYLYLTLWSPSHLSS